MTGAYWEISRELNFWQDSKLSWMSAHVEYNGGLNSTMSFNNAFLGGLTYSGHSKDFSKTWSLSAMYKAIPGTVDANSNSQIHNFQITGAWGIEFARGWCSFSGFFDIWREARPWQFALTAVLIEGLIFIILTLTNVREAIVNAIPLSLRNAIGAGIGLFIAFIGLIITGKFKKVTPVMIILAILFVLKYIFI